jgi:hypothetical protein
LSSRRYAIEAAIKKENVRIAEAIAADRQKTQLEAEAEKRRATKRANADRLLSEAQASNLTASELNMRIKNPPHWTMTSSAEIMGTDTSSR